MIYSGRLYDTQTGKNYAFDPTYYTSFLYQYNHQNVIGGRSFTKGWSTLEDGEDVITFFAGNSIIKRVGSPYAIETLSNEMWRYSVQNNEYMVLHYNSYSSETENNLSPNFEEFGKYNSSNIPGARYNHEMVQLNEDEVLLLAGVGYFTTIVDLNSDKTTLPDWWIYSTVLNQWKVMGGSFPNIYSPENYYNFGDGSYAQENNIGKRAYLTAPKINSEEILIFGGAIEGVENSVSQKYNISSNQWRFLGGDYGVESVGVGGSTREYQKTNLIGGRQGHFMFNFSETEIGIFGGYGHAVITGTTPGKYLNDIWFFNHTSENWKFGGKDTTRYPDRITNIPSNQNVYSDDTIVGGLSDFAAGYDSIKKELFICAGTGFGLLSSPERLDNCWKMYFGNMCFLLEDRNPLVCSSHGICSSHDTCECNDGYYGENCHLTKCFDHLSNDTDACNKKGLCIDSKCLCYESSAYNNPDCSVNEELKQLQENLWIYILVPVLIVIFIIVIIVLLILAIFLFFKLSKTLKKFDGIEDVDLVLKEAKLEQNSTNPKIKIDKSLFEIEYKDLNLISIIGEGGSGTVIYLSKWKGNFCAFKLFRTYDINSSGFAFDEFEKEVKIYSSINHPSILQFYGACINPQHIGILMEYCNFGDLNNFLNSYMLKQKRNYDTSEKIRILKEITSGMNYLHDREIIHRDLKPENVLIDDNEHAKIMDFGLSKLSRNQEKTMTKQIGTSYYMAPEVFIGIQNYTNKCDVYSWAILAFVVITENFFPYGIGTNQSKIIQRISKNPNFRPKIEENDFKECKFLIDLIKRNWNQNPEKRNDFKEIEQVLENEKKKMNRLTTPKDFNGKKSMKIEELVEKVKKLESEIALKDKIIEKLQKK